MSKRFALFTQNLSGGGAERVMLTLAAGLAERGYDIDLVLASAVGPYLKDVPSGVRIIDLERPLAIKTLRPFCGYLKENRPDAVLAALSQPCVIAALSRKFFNVRTVLSVHNTLSQEAKRTSFRHRMMPLSVRSTFGFADAIVAVSNGVLEDFRRFAPKAAHLTQLIYNPVVSDSIIQRSYERPELELLANRDTPTILAIGRLNHQKNFPLLINAFNGIKNQVNARLVILGEGDRRGELEEQVRALGIQRRVFLPGFVDNPYACIRNSDVLALSSNFEGLPTVLVEGLALGANIVSTDSPNGPREILDNGKYGRLSPISDARQLSQALLEAIRDPIKPPESSWAPYRTENVLNRYGEILHG